MVHWPFRSLTVCFVHVVTCTLDTVGERRAPACDDWRHLLTHVTSYLFINLNSHNILCDSIREMALSADLIQNAIIMCSLITCSEHHEFVTVVNLTVFTCVLAIGSTSVCPSVHPSICPSVTRWYCIKTAEHIAMLSSPHDSPFILVLYVSRSSRNSDGVTPCVAAKQRWGMKISQFSTNNLLRNGWR